MRCFGSVLYRSFGGNTFTTSPASYEVCHTSRPSPTIRIVETHKWCQRVSSYAHTVTLSFTRFPAGRLSRQLRFVGTWQKALGVKENTPIPYHDPAPDRDLGSGTLGRIFEFLLANRSPTLTCHVNACPGNSRAVNVADWHQPAIPSHFGGFATMYGKFVGLQQAIVVV